MSETEAVIRIQSQAGVEEFGQLVFGYSSATEKLEVEYVRVRKPDGQVVVTPESTAQDFAPDVLKEAPMYSDYRQRHISVAALEPGDTLEYRTVTRVLTPLAREISGTNTPFRRAWRSTKIGWRSTSRRRAR